VSHRVSEVLGLAMRYIRARGSNGVVSSRRVAPKLSVLAVSFAAACVPTSDLSSYSNAAASAATDLGEDDTPPPTSNGARPDEGAALMDTPGTGESIPGSGAVLDPNGASAPSNGTSTGEDAADFAAEGTAPDAGPRADAALEEPAEGTPPDADPPLPPSCTLEETAGPNGHCYVMVATPLAWDSARTNCQRRGDGWDLTSIRNAADSSFVTGLLDGESWVGGSDAASEETWAWVDDGFEFWQGEGDEGEPVNGAFANWFEDEPNGSTSSQCLRLLTDSRWADLECNELRPSLCEGPPR
jgi:hypothetical protein